MNTMLSALLVLLATLVSTARSKGMKGCHHRHHKMKKGCGHPTAPTNKPAVRMAPTGKPSRPPTTTVPTPNRCPAFEITGVHKGYLYARVLGMTSRDDAFAAAATFHCCGAQGALAPLNERSSVAIEGLMEESSSAWVAETDSSSLCRYVYILDLFGSDFGACDAERDFIVEFACVGDP